MGARRNRVWAETGMSTVIRRLPLPLAAAFIAGKNVEIRDLRMKQARETNNAKQREYLVEVARQHHRMAMQSVADARKRFRDVAIFGAEVRS